VDLGEVQTVKLEDLKGIDDVIRALEANVILPLEHSELAAELALKPKRGVLLAAPSPRDLDSIQSLELDLAGHDVQIEARVRHVRQAPGGEHLIGFEFLSIPSALETSVD